MFKQGKEVEKSNAFWWNVFSLSLVCLVILIHFGMFLVWGPYKLQTNNPEILWGIVLVVNLSICCRAWVKLSKR